jgi:curved DNA-binding protein
MLKGLRIKDLDFDIICLRVGSALAQMKSEREEDLRTPILIERGIIIMTVNNDLTDYYELLQINPNADTETIEKVFRMLAKRYHPDNGITGSSEKFSMIMDAYRVLSDPEKRASYDITYPEIQRRKWQFQISISSDADEEDEKRTRYDILSALYLTRKKNVRDPGVGTWHLEKLLGYPEELMEFEMWYLKEKGWLSKTENGKFAITADGVDIVEKNKLVPNHFKLLPLPEHMN